MSVSPFRAVVKIEKKPALQNDDPSYDEEQDDEENEGEFERQHEGSRGAKSQQIRNDS